MSLCPRPHMHPGSLCWGLWGVTRGCRAWLAAPRGLSPADGGERGAGRVGTQALPPLATAIPISGGRGPAGAGAERPAWGSSASLLFSAALLSPFMAPEAAAALGEFPGGRDGGKAPTPPPWHCAPRSGPQFRASGRPWPAGSERTPALAEGLPHMETWQQDLGPWAPGDGEASPPPSPEP